LLDKGNRLNYYVTYFNIVGVKMKSFSKITLLEYFIKDQLEQYEEPTRMGTPRGELIGLSKVKYHACLLTSLTNRKQEEIANELNISHSLLRKWRTERMFKAVSGDNIRRFGSDLHNTADKLAYQFVSSKAIQLSDESHYLESHYLFSDRDIYSDEVKKEAAHRAYEDFKLAYKTVPVRGNPIRDYFRQTVDRVIRVYDYIGVDPPASVKKAWSEVRSFLYQESQKRTLTKSEVNTTLVGSCEILEKYN
jgi:hypothetical protein